LPSTVFGLPAHALLVHATVVLVPLSALAVLLYAFWPAARRRLGGGMPLLAGVAVVLTPLSTQSGEVLEHEVAHSDLIEQHARLADGLLPWTIGLFVVAAGLWWLDRRRAGAGSAGPRPEPRWLPLVAGVLAVVAVVGVVQQVVRVGHAGAEATWQGVVQTASSGG
jgi:hypothetical protein